MVASGDRFGQMKNVDAMLYRVFVEILQKVVHEMVVRQLDFSSFSMTKSNPIHLVIVVVIQDDMDMNDDTVVEIVVEDCIMVKDKVVYEMLMVFDSEE
jgi:hypothetical protein